MLLWVFTQETNQLRNTIISFLKPRPFKLKASKDYIYAEGDIPILLVAHIDTVHKAPPRKDDIIIRNNCLMMNKSGGLGADDRAGVMAILEIIKTGLMPHVLFLDGEEKFGRGAKAAVKELPIPKVNYIIELDRKGHDEAVFYDCINTDFIDYILSFGFKTERGTFTDISILCPEWGIAGVNLSIGFHNAHSTLEVLDLRSYVSTMDKLTKMLKNPPDKQFEYIGRYYDEYLYGYDYHDEYEDFHFSYNTPVRVACKNNLDPASPKFSIYFRFDAEKLASIYGGTVSEWKQWLNQYGNGLRDALEDALWETLFDFCALSNSKSSVVKGSG